MPVLFWRPESAAVNVLRCPVVPGRDAVMRYKQAVSAAGSGCKFLRSCAGLIHNQRIYWMMLAPNDFPYQISKLRLRSAFKPDRLPG